jgi:amino acid adenylation domain-containing protein
MGQRIAGRAPIYNMALAFSLHGIDTQRFTHAYRKLTSAFVPLRSSVQEGPEGPILDFASARPHDLTFLDLRLEERPERAARKWMRREAACPFETGDALCRSALIRLSNEHFLWFVNQHHLIADAWSCSLLLEAMDRIYHDDASFEPEIQIGRTGDIGDEQRLEQARQYWNQVYRSVPEQDAIFGQFNPDRDPASDRLTYELGPEEVEQLQAVAVREFPAISSTMSLFVAFSALLVALVSRISQRRRIGFEAPFTNRATKHDQKTPGLFIDLFPVAADVDGTSSFCELGRQIQKQVPAILKYGMPGAAGTSTNNGCDAVLNFMPFKLGSFGGHPVSSEFVHSGAHDVAHVLRLQIWDLRSDGGLTIMFDMNRSVISEDNQATVVDYFKSLLSSFLQAPSTRVASIPLLSEAHRTQLIDGFNDAASQPSPTRTIVEGIYEQARRTPKAPALECEGKQRSFEELTVRVNAIAASLMALGVTRGDHVCITARRSMTLVESILAIMRLGAAYVPVDPDYPGARRAMIYETVQPRLVLSDIPAGDSAAPEDVVQVQIETFAQGNSLLGSQYSDLPDWSQLALDDLAYILFTSGSTGTPKGVPVSQMGLAVYLQWACSVYADEKPVNMPLVTSISFDLTVTSIFLPLLCGGRVVVYAPTTDAFDDGLFRAAEEDRVDTIKLTPSHLRLLLRRDLHRSRIRNLIVGGEQFTVELANSVSKQIGDVRIFNEYGPTEAVVGCMIYQFMDDDTDKKARTSADGSFVPIGKPAHQTRVYLLNEGQQPVHPDVTGELYIQRQGAPNAYYKNLQSSATAFLPDLVSPQQTMYRTGDLARFNQQGDLVFLGRIDQQIKVAGHRVEIEEVENALHSIDTIDTCCVLLDRPPEAERSITLHCSVCGIGDDTPGVKLDEAEVCNLCRDFQQHAPRIEAYFRQRDELQEVIARAAQRKKGDYDCLVLLSGGKDSTYALYQVIRMGFNVRAMTLDNGYVSPQARANIERVVNELGIEHEFAATEYMPQIFNDSLNRFSNVCQGCFKTLYTLSLRRAAELGIPAIITGLSRGQLFETRLNLGLFRGDRDDEEIDSTILQARKAYHRRSDAVTQYLGNEDFKDDGIFDEIELIDFYRHWSASLTEMLSFLQQKTPWIRPSDTGRSTNCLINDVGIFVHRSERRFHNYALPYSWDVRLRQKNRDQAIEDLNDEVDVDLVTEILRDIAYTTKQAQDHRAEQLVAFYTTSGPTDPDMLRSKLEAALPNWSVPHRFVQVDSIPLTINGKLDRDAILAKLPTKPMSSKFRPPATETEMTTADIWSELLPTTDIGGDDNFFELGGTSIEAIEFMTRLCDQFAIDLPLDLIFLKPVLSDFAAELESALIAQIDSMSDAEILSALND